MNGYAINRAPFNGTGEVTEAPERIVGHNAFRLEVWKENRTVYPWAWYLSRTFPVISFNARIRDGRPSYLSAVIHVEGIEDEEGYFDGLPPWQPATGPIRKSEMRLYHLVVDRSGRERSNLVLSAFVESYRLQHDANRRTYTLTGYKTRTTYMSRSDTIYPVEIRYTRTGKRIVNCRFSPLIQAGNLGIIPENDDLIMSTVNISATNNSIQCMVQEK